MGVERTIFNEASGIYSASSTAVWNVKHVAKMEGKDSRFTYFAFKGQQHLWRMHRYFVTSRSASFCATVVKVVLVLVLDLRRVYVSIAIDDKDWRACWCVAIVVMSIPFASCNSSVLLAL